MFETSANDYLIEFMEGAKTIGRSLPTLASKHFALAQPKDGFGKILAGAFGLEGAIEILSRCSEDEDYKYAANRLRSLIAQTAQTTPDCVLPHLPDERVTRIASSGMNDQDLEQAIQKRRI